MKVALQRRRDSDSVPSLAGSGPVASGEMNQATAVETDIIPVSVQLIDSLVQCLSSWISAVLLVGSCHLSVCLILTQFNQHLLQPWMIGWSRLGRPFGQLKHGLIYHPAGSEFYYQWLWKVQPSVPLLIDNRNPVLIDNITPLYMGVLIKKD